MSWKFLRQSDSFGLIRRFPLGMRNIPIYLNMKRSYIKCAYKPYTFYTQFLLSHISLSRILRLWGTRHKCGIVVGMEQRFKRPFILYTRGKLSVEFIHSYATAFKKFILVKRYGYTCKMTRGMTFDVTYAFANFAPESRDDGGGPVSVRIGNARSR